jgi:GAF domain-containing protein
MRFRSGLAVPMLRDEQVIGAVYVGRSKPGLFSDTQVELLQTFADQAVIAIENVRLFKELESRNRDLTESLEQQTATSEILRVISGSPTDVQPVVDAVAESAARLCEAFDSTIYRREADRLLLVAHRGSIPVGPVGEFSLPLVRGTAAGRAALDGRTVHIGDMQTEADEFPDSSENARRMGFRTILVVPLMREGAAIGVIGILRAEARLFSERQVALLQTFADQAVIAIENVRLFTELQASNRELSETLAQQTATAEVLKVISRSTFDLGPVLETLIENAARLCRAEAGCIYRLDGQLQRLAAAYNVSPEHRDFVERNPLPPGPGTAVGRAMLERRAVQIPDVQKDPSYTYYGGVALGGYRTLLGVPMMREGEPIGVFAVWRSEALPFTDKQIELVTTFADQGAIAIENVRLFKELEARNRDLTATSEILRVIASSPTDVQPVFATVAASAARLCDAFDATIFRIDADGLRVVAHEGPIPAHPVGHGPAMVRGTPPGRSVLDRQTIHVADMQAETEEYPEGSEHARRFGHRTVLVVPLIHAGEAMGAIAVRRTEVRPFTDRQIELLKTFADQAVIAIENVRLFTELQASNRELTTALDTQTATSDMLRVISSSPTDVQPVFDTIAQSAVRLCDGLYSFVVRFDGRLIHFAAHHNMGSSALEEVRRSYPMEADRQSINGLALIEARVVHVRDVERQPDVPARGRDLARAFGFKSVVAVPMVRDGHAVGSISVARGEAKPFSDGEIALLQTFADQAVIAIENVRLFSELQTSNRELTTALDTQTATSDILRVISRSQTDIQPVFDAIVASAIRLLRADVSVLTRVVGVQLELAAHSTTSEQGDAAVRAAYPLPLDSEWPHVRSIRERVPFNIADTEIDPRVPEALRAIARARSFRGLVTVPLLHRDETLGAIAVARHDAGGFTDEEIALLKTFADQAVIAIENVRLFNETKEALEQQTATAEILRVISSSPTDLQPVFDAIVDNAQRLLRGHDAVLARVVGDHLHLAASNAVTEAAREATRNDFPRPIFGHRSTSSRAVRDRIPVMEEDLLTNPDVSPAGRELARVRGFRSVLSVPLLREGEAIGAINVSRATPGPFTDEEIALLKTFADQAVIAIENARLLTELHARTAELTQSVGELQALGEVGQAISSTLDLQTVLSTIVARATQLSGTDAGVIYEYDEQREVFLPRATEHLEAEIVETMLSTPVRKGEGATGRLAEVQEPIQLPDILDAPAESRVRGALVHAGYRALLAIPLVREDHLLGGLTVIRKATGAFAPGTIELLQTFATQSSLAIQNARLFLEIEDKSRQLEVASQHKSEFLANMSHELRTPMNAILGFSEVLAEGMFGEINDKQAEYLRDILESGRHLLSLINDILDLSKIEAGRMELEPTDFDLPGAIDNALTLVRERASRRGIMLGRAIDERVGMIRADERKVKQVLLNLLSNALKFTPEGGRIDVRATLSDGRVEVSVADTGVGIAPEDQEAVFEEFRQVGTADKKVEGTGLGLALSRKFIELHGGRIWVKSQLGQGSTFTFTLPVRRGG